LAPLTDENMQQLLFSTK